MNIIDELNINKKIYLDILIDNNKKDKLIIELFNNKLPKTCNNFIELCKNKAYANTSFYKLVKNKYIQGGDIINNDGSGGISIYGNKFNDENFDIKHDSIGILSMANKGKNTNNSNFIITFDELSELDNNNVGTEKKLFQIIYLFMD